MRTARTLLAATGAGLAGYGAWLLWPRLPTAWTWLVAGPLLHDLVVAPLVLLTGLAARRLVRHPTYRTWLVRALTVSAILLLIAVPLVWRPRPAPPNPGLQDRDYATGLAIWLAALWLGALLGALAARRRDRRRRP
ncbi:hypothetical protein RB614_42805 [Phytohabitans sp. ZYX-F-186]|uniref:Lipoprotein n=1 Tax=Phytohabitans maris TaxID=3071409 RepID=A0ABU0ZWQ2_9ACTN|nr:hypothetical protein [Phytohabitans sp. ZYX-F-186]MDQ7911241.1 hypothetical protein [Phytohabitans sp. ZYX-F-186]